MRTFRFYRVTQGVSRFHLIFLIGLIILAGYQVSYQVPEAEAIPAFARKENFACNVCHVPSFPKLNDFGNLFRDHGFQLGSDQDLPDYEGITMGYWPVSFRSPIGYRATNLSLGGNTLQENGFGFKNLQILSYGVIKRNVSFGLSLLPNLQDASFGSAPGPGPNSGDLLNAAFVRLSDIERLLGLTDEENSYMMNLSVGIVELDYPFPGQFRQPFDVTSIAVYQYTAGMPFQRSGPNFLPQFYQQQNGAPGTIGYSNPENFNFIRPKPGIQLFGIVPTDFTDGYFRYEVNGITNNQAVQGNGRNAGFYGHVTQSFGGYGIVTGHRVGVFGVWNSVPTENNNPICQPASQCNGNAGSASGAELYRIGADVSLTHGGEWNLFGIYMYANDSKNMFASQGVINAQAARWQGGFVELDYYPNELPFLELPGWFFAYRFGWVRNIQQGDPTFADDYNNVNSHAFVMRYNFHISSRTDIAWVTEFNYSRANAVGAANLGQPDQSSQIVFSGFDFAF